MALTLKTIYVRMADLGLTGAPGRVIVTPSADPIRDNDGSRLLTGTISFPFVAGVATLQLPPTDGDTDPTGFTYRIQVLSHSGSIVADAVIELPAASAAVEFADLLDLDPAVSDPQYASVVTQAALDAALALKLDTTTHTAHVAAADPHPGYQTEAGLDAAVEALVSDTGSNTYDALSATFAKRLQPNPAGTVDPDSAEIKLTGTNLLTTPVTPYGHNDVVHPSVVRIPGGWNGFEYWMAITPLNGVGDVEEENPCIYVSNDGDTWTTPPGLTNPIDESPAGSAYNADTHLIYHNNQLYCFWTENNSGSGFYDVRYRTSPDGVTWSAEGIAHTSVYSVKRTLSPAVHYFNGLWHLWSVDDVASPNTVTYETATTLGGTWTVVGNITVTPALPSTRDLWHLEVHRYGDEWHMLLNDTILNQSGGEGDLYFLTSKDGLTWSRGRGALLPRLTPWARSHYKSAMTPAGRNGQDGYDVWVNVFGQVASLHRRLWRGKLAFSSGGRLTDDERHGQEMQAALVPLAPYVAADNWRRTDGALGTAPTGQAWTTDAGTPAITSYLVGASVSEETRAVVNAGIADCMVEVELRANTITGDGGVVFRRSAANNYWFFGWSSGFKLVKYINGSATSTTLSNVPTTWALTDKPVRIGVRLQGSAITLYVNRIQMGSVVTDSQHSTATSHGFAFKNNGTKIGDFFVRALPR